MKDGIVGSDDQETFEPLHGELDAAVVFAAAAEEQYCADQRAFGDVCRSDANDLYTNALERISPNHLAEDRQQLLAAKLECLKLILERLRVLRLSMRDEAVSAAPFRFATLNRAIIL